MNAETMKHAVFVGGGIQAAIVLANVPLPRRLQVRKHLSGVPHFLRQIFYVHWLYIVIIVALFSVLSFAFAAELTGTTRLGTFLSASMALFWLLRMALQWFYYDAEVRRQERVLDLLYGLALIVLVAIYGTASLRALMRQP